MGKHLEWLTVELERASSKTSLTCPISDVVEEARCHIVSSQEALMELGLSEEIAEEEAVKRFGSAQVYVKSLAHLYQPKPQNFDVPTLAVLLLATVFTIFFICRQDAKSPVMWIGWGVFLVLAMFRMWVVRRVQWSLLGLFIPASILLGIAYPLSWMNPRGEAMGHLDASAASEYRASLATMIPQYDRVEAELRQSLLEKFSPVAPFGLTFTTESVSVRTKKYADMAEAADLRTNTVPKLLEMVQQRRLHDYKSLTEVEEALSTPLWKRMLLDFKIGPYFGLGWTFMLMSLNLMVVALRVLYERTKRVLKLA